MPGKVRISRIGTGIEMFQGYWLRHASAGT